MFMALNKCLEGEREGGSKESPFEHRTSVQVQDIGNRIGSGHG